MSVSREKEPSMSKRTSLFGGLTLAGTALLFGTGCPFLPFLLLLLLLVPQQPAEFRSADVVRGGKLYDKWWEVDGVDPNKAVAPTDPHPLWDTDRNPQTSAADTWRCKQCHGWDYKGKTDLFATGAGSAGIPGILNTTLSPQEVFDLIKGGSSSTAQGTPNHNYGSVLSDADIWDLTRFVFDGTIDTSTMIDPSGAFSGDENTGQNLWNDGFGSAASCPTCHGPDGRCINFAGGDEEEYVGTVAADNPWEFQHKVRFGQPGADPNMPNWIDAGATLDDVADLGAYAQTLPTSGEQLCGGGGGTGGTTGDATSGQNLYDTYCSTCHALGSHDTTGSPDLSGHANEVVNDLTTISAAMAAVGPSGNGTLTDQEVADLKAFISQN